MIAGIVTPSPNAMDSPAEPAVWTMLFSRMVASRRPNFENRRKNVIDVGFEISRERILRLVADDVGHFVRRISQIDFCHSDLSVARAMA
jgi:hypothetical protein